MIKRFEKELLNHYGWVGVDIDYTSVQSIKLYFKDEGEEVSKLLFPNISNKPINRSETLYLNYIYKIINPFDSKKFDFSSYVSECGCSSFYEDLRFIYNVILKTSGTAKNPLNIIGKDYLMEGLKVYYTFAIYKKSTDKFCKFENYISNEILNRLSIFFHDFFHDNLLEQVSEVSKSSIISGIGLNISSKDVEVKVYMDCYCREGAYNATIFDITLSEYHDIATNVIKFMSMLGYSFILVGLANTNAKLRLYFKK